MWETQKAELRKDIRSRLKSMPEEEKRILDREIAERVLGLPEIAETKAVYGYASLSWEAGTGEILEELWAQKYIICLPKVTGETMEFFVTESEQDLSEGSFHIMEPKNGCRKRMRPDQKSSGRRRSWSREWDLWKPVPVWEKAADSMTGIWNSSRSYDDRAGL